MTENKDVVFLENSNQITPMEDIKLLEDTQPKDGASTQPVPIESSFEDENIRNHLGQWG